MSKPTQTGWRTLATPGMATNATVRLWQHWSRPRGAGTKAVGVIYCEQCHERCGGERPGVYVVRLSPSQSRGRRCMCGFAVPKEAGNG